MTQAALDIGSVAAAAGIEKADFTTAIFVGTCRWPPADDGDGENQ